MLLAGRILVVSLPVLDVVVAQLVPLLSNEGVGSILGKAVRAAVLVVVVLILATSKLKNVRMPRRILAGLAVISFAVVVGWAVEMQRNGFLVGSAVSYLKIFYWVVLAIAHFALVTDGVWAKRVLISIVVGTLIASLSILLGFVVGGRNVYAHEGITASVGFFQSGKTIAGPLIVGMIAAWIIWFRDHRSGTALLMLVMLVALLATQARAGQVALVLALAAIAVRRIVLKRQAPVFKLATLAAAVFASAALFGLIVILREVVFARWEDVADVATAGSGRLTLWIAAVQELLTRNWLELAFGAGYESALQVSQDAVGVKLHLHSDLFDLLVMFGVVGLLGYTVLAAGAMRIGSLARVAPNLAEAIWMVVVVWVVSGFLTGQLFGEYAMVFYFAAINAFFRLSQATREVGHVA